MGMATILAGMPDMWRDTLAAHVPDQHGYCQTCRNSSGVSATWPCRIREVAEEAKYIHDGGLPGTFTGRHSRH
ncbi:MAG: hypothetical protein GEU83_00700 [Pseudonocardiaceae bacterium]|nr:hypothetical protein [Pseudonocardiaceae bacterium]